MNILYIEDEALIVMVAEMALEDDGHTVKNIIGAASVGPDGLVGITADGRDEVINIDEYDMVLIDGDLKGDFKGMDIVPHIVGGNRMIVAVSGNDDNNKAMVRLGANEIAAKPFVMDGVKRILRNMASQTAA